MGSLSDRNGEAVAGEIISKGLDSFRDGVHPLPLNLKPLVTFLYYCGVRLGEAEQIEWHQVDLPAALIRLEEDQTKNSEAPTIPLPDVLVKMLKQIDKKEGAIFDTTNLRKEWHKACVASGLGTLIDIEGKADPRYTGLIIHDLRRSAIKNLMKAGVNEKVAMKISGHKTRDVFDRYHIVDTEGCGSDAPCAGRSSEKRSGVQR